MHVSKAIGITAACTTAAFIGFMPVSPAVIYKRVAPSVVTIKSVTMERDPFEPNKLRERTTGTGTGFVYLRDDIVVTNAHIVKDAFKVKINDVDAEIINIDELDDVAVLSYKQQQKDIIKSLKKCLFEPEVGDPVLTIGNPYGFDKTMTHGIVSGLDRSLDNDDSVTPLVNLIQTDASINPGNSGGPLLHGDNGCVLGMNTAFVSPNGSSTGLGFAIPIQTVEDITTDTKMRSVLGITVLPDSYARGLGIDGVIIAQVVPGSLADQMGYKGTYRDENGIPHIGDVITEFNGHKIKKRSDLYSAISLLKAT